LISGTPGPGQSVPHNTLSAMSSIRGKYSSNFCGGIPENIHVHILVPAHQEKCLLHPQRPAAVRQDHHQIRIVDTHVVA
jgi:hypothetical protein